MICRNSAKYGLTVAAVIALLVGSLHAQVEQDQIIAQARAALESGLFQGALELAEKAAAMFPERAEAWFVLGAARQQQPGGAEGAIEAYREAIRLNPDRPDAYMAVGRIHLKRMRLGGAMSSVGIAIDSFTRVIELNPSHPEAYWLRGVAFLEGRGDSVRAGADFETQLEVVRGHPEASVHLLQLAVDTGEFRLAEELAAPMLVALKWDLRIYRPMLQLYIEMEEWKAAALVSGRFLDVLPAGELDVIYDLSPLLPKSRKGTYEQLDADARMHFWRNYWSERGGADLKRLPTRWIEHIWRVTEARHLFGRRRFPWDFRGELFVRYGPPDYRITDLSGTNLDLIVDDLFLYRLNYRMFDLNMPYSAIDAIMDEFRSSNTILERNASLRGERFEIWIYKSRGLLFRLSDPLMRDEFQPAFPVDQQFDDNLQSRLPVISKIEEITEPLHPMLQIAQFRGLEGKTRLHTYISLPVIELTGALSGNLPSTIVSSSVILTDDSTKVVAEGSRERWLHAGPSTEVQRSRRFVEAISFLVNAGNYWFTTFMEHPDSDRVGSFGPRRITIRDYSNALFSMSDVVLAATDSLGRFESNLLDEGILYLPQPGSVFDLEKPFIIYFELYNLQRDQAGISTYDITYEVFPEPRSRVLPEQLEASTTDIEESRTGSPAVSMTSTYRSLRPDVMHSIVLSMKGHAEDFYRLRVSLEDSLSGERLERETTFRVLYSIYPPPIPPTDCPN